MATIKEVTDAAAIISYMGEVVSAPKAGQTKRIKIKGKYMDDDILVEAANVAGGGATAIISNGKAITIETAPVTEDGENTISIGG